MHKKLAALVLCGATALACAGTQAQKPGIPASQLLGQQRSALRGRGRAAQQLGALAAQLRDECQLLLARALQ